MRKFADLIVASAFVTYLVFGIVTIPQQWDQMVKPAHAQPIVLGPNVYSYANVTAAQSLIGVGQSRHGLQICNSGGTNPLWLMPNTPTVNTGAIVNPATNVGFQVPAVTAATQPCFAPPVGVTSIGQSWLGFSIGTPVTVLEWP